MAEVPQMQEQFAADRQGWRKSKKKPPASGGFQKAAREPRFANILFRLRLLEHAIQSLIRGVAAGLSRLRRLQSLVRSALSTRRSLLCLRCRALSSVCSVLRSFSSRTNSIELFRGDTCAAGQQRKAADERRCTQSSLDFCDH